MVVRPQQDARRRAKEKAHDPLGAALLTLEEALNVRARARVKEKAQDPAVAALLSLKEALNVRPCGEGAETAEFQSRAAATVGVTNATSPRLAEETLEVVSGDQLDSKVADLKQGLEFVVSLLPRLPPGVDAGGEALWDQAVESLGRSAGVMKKLAESTGEALARIAARGDRIDRIQKETRELLNALVASEADA